MIRRASLAVAALGWGLCVAFAAQATAPSRSIIPETRPTIVAPSVTLPTVGPALPLAAATMPPPRPSGPVQRVPDTAAIDHALAEAVADIVLTSASSSASVPRGGLVGGISRAIASPAAAATASAVRAPQPGMVRPAPRPTALATAAVATRTPIVASRLAVLRSPQPARRSEPARQRYLQFLQRAAAVRTQPVPPAITGQAAGNLCGVRGIEGQTIAPIARTAQGCGVANPVRVTAVDGVRLSTAAVMECDTARALHSWVRTGVKPAVGNHGGGVVELRVAAHYVCRTRNHRPGAPISEHGRGRAIDISAIRLANGEVFTVLRGWRDRTYGPMLKAMHRAACGTFSTTLGPGSDGMHEDHFHYDTAQRRMSSAICR